MMYNFIIKLLVLETVVVRVSMTINVRTALFSHADLAKKQWYPRDVALLKARMYLQDLIPAVQVSQSPEYVSSLLRYIRDCYASVNRESFDGDTKAVLTDALSDVMGGYLKMVALPVTKSVYYSGGLPTRDALEIFKYYEDIKRHLHTRGTSWGNQVKGVVKTENVRDARSDFNIKIKDPCQRLLYLQNAQQNLSMPMPSIDWQSRMMFVPLTDQPIVDIRSPYIAPILQKFHKVASACERSIIPDNSGKRLFQESFEGWANNEVVPHLSDDELYTAFKGILNLIETIVPEQRPILFTDPVNLSTNSLIIISVLVLELICCIPTLLYLMKKTKNNTNKSRSMSSLSLKQKVSCECSKSQSKDDLHNRDVCYIDKRFFKLSSHSSAGKNLAKEGSAVDFLSYKKYSGTSDKANSDLSSALDTQCSYSSVTNVATTVQNVPVVKKYCNKRDKKTQPSSLQLFHYQHTETDRIDVTQGQTQVSTKVLLPKATSTSTDINFDTSSRKEPSNDTTDTVTMSTVERDKSAKALRKSKRFRRRPGSPMRKESSIPLTYSQRMLPIDDIRAREKNKVSRNAQEVKLEIYGAQMWDESPMRTKPEKRVEFASPHFSLLDETSVIINEVSGAQLPKVLSNKGSTREIKVLDGNKPQKEDQVNPTFEVRIERSRQHIQAQLTKSEEEGIARSSKGILKGAEEKQMLRKTSKIPKRIQDSSIAPSETTSRPRPAVPSSPGRRSQIPTRKRALDDSAILSSSPRETHLNITL